MPQSALLLIDLQNDFCPGGALAVSDGDATIAVANRLLAWSQQHQYPAIATLDWHPARHGSFAKVQGTEPYSSGELDGIRQTWWPTHCVQYSQGAQLHPALDRQKIAHCITKGENPLIDSYSAFFDNGHRQATGLDTWLREHHIDKLIVMGLATDYCVKFSVLDALTLGYQVTVIEDGCRGVNIAPNDSTVAFNEMAAAGANICTLDEWLAQ